jgi:hypothetical protein
MKRQSSESMRRLALLGASCLLALSGCGGSEEHSLETGELASPLANEGYWAGVTKAFPRTPTGHVAAIGRHNCYVTTESTSSANLTKTNATVQAAINANADLLEFDIKEEGGRVYVHHEDNGSTNGPLLANVLDNPALQADDAVLYIEIKETSTSATLARQVLDILRARKTWYARDGRPVVFRGFHSRRANLAAIQSLLPEYPDLSPYIRLHVFFEDDNAADMAAFHTLIRNAKTQGLHGVEFPYADKNLLSKIAYAKAQGLGVTLWTIPDSMGEVFLSNLREEVDAFVCEYDVTKARGSSRMPTNSST